MLIVEGYHDAKFSKNREFHFNANTLSNAERHIQDTHMLDARGDTWRIISTELIRAQASGVVNGSYSEVIPFRQQEFVNAFLEWTICDSIKYRKVTSKRLKRCFKIANIKIVNALPDAHSTIEQ